MPVILAPYLLDRSITSATRGIALLPKCLSLRTHQFQQSHYPDGIMTYIYPSTVSNERCYYVKRPTVRTRDNR